MALKNKISSIKGSLSGEDRLELAKLLLKAGYAAKLSKARPNGKSSGPYEYFVEYWEE